MALIPLNTFKTKTAVLTTLNYNQAKCARDTALIIDSIASDLLYGGTTQTAFAAIQYWAQGQIKIPGEVFQTVSAMEYAKEIAIKIIKKETVELQPIPSYEYDSTNLASDITNIEQVFTGSAGSENAATIIDSEFELIMDVIQNGIAGTTDRIVSNSDLTTDTGLSNASSLLLANKEFLQQEVSRYVKNKFYAGYKFNRTKCSRDIGLIVDSLASDLLFEGSTQSTFSGLQYWSQGSSSIPNESLQTIAAIQQLQTLLNDVVTNTTITSSTGNSYTQIIDNNIYVSSTTSTTINSLITFILNIITNGTTGVSDIIEPNGTKTTDENLVLIVETIQKNKKFLQTEIVSWINTNITSASSSSIWYQFTYNKDRCFRDVGYIIDCVSFDMLYGGNRQVIQAGVYYYGFSTTSSFQNGNRFSATAATIAGTTLTVTGSLTGTIAIGQYITGTGVVAGTKIISKNSNSWEVDKTNNVNTSISSLAVLSSFNSTASSISGTTLTIGGTVTGTVEAGQYIVGTGVLEDTYIVSGSGTSWVVSKAQTVGPIAISTGSFTSTTSAINGNILTVNGTVTGIIAAGQYIQGDGVISGTYIISKLSGSGAGSTWLVSKNHNPVVSGKAISSYGFKAITTEITETISAYNFMKSLIGDIIESQPITDLYQTNVKQVLKKLKGSNVESVKAQDNIDIITDIILNGPSTDNNIEPISLTESINKPNSYAHTLLIANKEFIKAEVVAYVDTITQSGFVYKNIFNAGSFIIGNTYKIVDRGSLATQTDFTLIGAVDNNIGTEFIATGIGAGSGKASSDYCKRDVGFIVDCISFDLLHGGNRQAMQAAVYYYGNSSSVSVVASEKTDTINAYNYMAIVMDAVIKGEKITTDFVSNATNGIKYAGYAPYQYEVSPFTNLPSTNSVSSLVYSLIGNVLTPIITTGPSLAPTRVPIGTIKASEIIAGNTYKIMTNASDTIYSNFTTTQLGTITPGVTTFVATSSGSVFSTLGSGGTSTFSINVLDGEILKAYNKIIANKDYIIAEVIGYMNSLKSPNTTKIYTAPPGVTGIVLMAQAANVTDHDIKITFSHYRNLPVFADPSTLNGFQAADTVTEIVKEFTIPPNDSATLIQGKMIIESFDSIVAYASESNGLKVTLSILETANA